MNPVSVPLVCSSPGIPANTPARSGSECGGPSVPAIQALARDHQEKLGAGGWMRADDTTRLDRQAGQMDLALARRDARGGESPAAVPADALLPGDRIGRSPRDSFW